jgi:hypothetical protein
MAGSAVDGEDEQEGASDEGSADATLEATRTISPQNMLALFSSGSFFPSGPSFSAF